MQRQRARHPLYCIDYITSNYNGVKQYRQPRSARGAPMTQRNFTQLNTGSRNTVVWIKRILIYYASYLISDDYDNDGNSLSLVSRVRNAILAALWNFYDAKLIVPRDLYHRSFGSRMMICGMCFAQARSSIRRARTRIWTDTTSRALALALENALYLYM